jgi:hypothetical protein
MTMHGTMHVRRCLTPAVVLALLAAISLTPATRAATSGNVAVTADIAPTLTLTLCDQTANFGSGLNASGDPATGTTDPITAIQQNPGFPDGAFYRWDPNCASGTNFLTVDSNVSWQSTICATEETHTSTLSLGDLRYTSNVSTLTYVQIPTTALNFPACTSPQVWTSGSSGTSFRDIVYYLQVDPGEGPGSFAATTTVAVTA